MKKKLLQKMLFINRMRKTFLILFLQLKKITLIQKLYNVVIWIHQKLMEQMLYSERK